MGAVNSTAMWCLCAARQPCAALFQVVNERNEAAAAKMHFWLERTAFYKVPKSHQDEVAEQCHKPFEQVGLSTCL